MKRLDCLAAREDQTAARIMVILGQDLTAKETLQEIKGCLREYVAPQTTRERYLSRKK